MAAEIKAAGLLEMMFSHKSRYRRRLSHKKDFDCEGVFSVLAMTLPDGVG